MKPIAEQKAIIDAATPGPWEPCGYAQLRVGCGQLCQCGIIWSHPADCPVATSFGGDDEINASHETAKEDNATFIAHSRTAYPELLAWAERARKHLDDLRALYVDALIGDFDDTESGSHEDFQEVLKLLSDLPTDTVTQSTQPENVSIKPGKIDIAALDTGE